ncbi:hypothetical protein [Micromonospora costi]|nr:hypothetical protein [Micromonospora costi]
MLPIRVGHRFPLLVMTAVAVAAVAGCGGKDEEPAPPAAAPPAVETTAEAAVAESPTAAAPTVDACSLVTKAEAEKLAGTRLDDAAPVRETCSYTGPVTGPTAQVEIFVGDGAKKILDIDRQLGHEFTPLSGVGDEAYLEDGQVFINKAGLWISIRLVRLNDPAENRKPLEELARTVAGRL